MNHIASTGILLFGLGYCIQSIASAFAFPSVSLSFHGEQSHCFMVAPTMVPSTSCKLRFHIDQWLQRQFFLSSKYQWNKCRPHRNKL